MCIKTHVLASVYVAFVLHLSTVCNIFMAEIIEWKDRSDDKWKRMDARVDYERYKTIQSTPPHMYVKVVFPADKSDIEFVDVSYEPLRRIPVQRIRYIKFKLDLVKLQAKRLGETPDLFPLQIRDATMFEHAVIEEHANEICRGIKEMNMKAFTRASVVLSEEQQILARKKMIPEPECEICCCLPDPCSETSADRGRKHIYLLKCCTQTACYACWKMRVLETETIQKRAKCFCCEAEFIMEDLVFNDLLIKVN